MGEFNSPIWRHALKRPFSPDSAFEIEISGSGLSSQRAVPNEFPSATLKASRIALVDAQSIAPWSKRFQALCRRRRSLEGGVNRLAPGLAVAARLLERALKLVRTCLRQRVDQGGRLLDILR